MTRGAWRSPSFALRTALKQPPSASENDIFRDRPIYHYLARNNRSLFAQKHELTHVPNEFTVVEDDVIRHRRRF